MFSFVEKCKNKIYRLFKHTKLSAKPFTNGNDWCYYKNDVSKGVMNMARAIDVANYLLTKESMTHKKLQKLCYYCQGWHIALLKKPLFFDEIQAWVHGPVIPSIYPHFADYKWTEIPKNNICNYVLSDSEKEVIDSVWETYREFSGDELEALSHNDLPWKKARVGLKPYEASDNPILYEDMRDYFNELSDESPNV